MDNIIVDTNKIISERKPLSEKWKEIKRYYDGDQWAGIKSNKALRQSNIIKTYAKTQTNLIMDTKPTIQMFTFDNSTLDEVKRINSYLQTIYSTSLFPELEQVVLDSVLYNFAVIRIFIEEGELKYKRVDPQKIYRGEGESVIFVNDKDIEVWDKHIVTRYTQGDDIDIFSEVDIEDNYSKTIPFIILNFEYSTGKDDYGRSTTNDLMPIQKESNKLRTELSYQIQMLTNPPLLVNADDVDSWKLKNILPGAVVRVDNPASVREMFPNRPHQVNNEIRHQLATIKNEVIEMTGISERQQGVLTKRLSGQAIAQLEQSSNLPTRSKQRVLEGFLRKMGFATINILRRASTKIRYFDRENNKVFNLDFSKINEFDIEVVATSNKLLTPSDRAEILKQFGDVLEPAEIRGLLFSVFNDFIPNSTERTIKKTDERDATTSHASPTPKGGTGGGENVIKKQLEGTTSGGNNVLQITDLEK